MGIFDQLTPNRRVAADIRGCRKALERIADVLELQCGHMPRDGQTFRGFSREKHPDRGDDRSGVSYTNPAEVERALQAEDRFRAVMGRDPTEAELERELRGDVE